MIQVILIVKILLATDRILVVVGIVKLSVDEVIWFFYNR